MTYLVTAYRYGFTADTYPVYAGSDRSTADRYAERESEYRGGKYAMQIVECIDGPDEMKFHPLRYIPSVWGESEPVEDLRAHALASLGSFAFETALHRRARVPSKDGRTLVEIPVTPPDWLVQRAMQAKEWIDSFKDHRL